MKKSNDTIGNRTHDLPAVAQYLNQLGHRVPHQYVRVTVKSRSITFCALSSSFIKHPRQQFKKNFTQRFEPWPLQDPGGSGVSKSRINSVVNFWLVWTQAWRSQTVYVWSSWLLSFQIRKRTLLVLGKQNATNNYVRNHYRVRRSWCDTRYNLSGYWPEFYRRRWQNSGHGNISPRVWYQSTCLISFSSER